jgi:DNA-directed RNA polymerase subunit M/transcription elongation factor TFIIS
MTAVERISLQMAFTQAMQKHSAFAVLSDDERAAIVRRIERSCFNSSIDKATGVGVVALFTDAQYRNIYSAECMRILSNLNPETAFSTYLIDNIIAGKIDVTKIAELRNDELDPGASKAERDDIALRQSQKTEIKVSRRYQCKKCGGNETIPIEYQSRNADEASSRSIKCVNCGNVWRS